MVSCQPWDLGKKKLRAKPGHKNVFPKDAEALAKKPQRPLNRNSSIRTHAAC